MLKNDSSSNGKETTAGLEMVSASLCAYVYDSGKAEEVADCAG